MSETANPRDTHCEISIQRIPDDVHPGDRTALTGSAKCDPPQDLRGRRLLIFDHRSEQVASLEFVDYDGETNTTTSGEVAAPSDVGTFTWKATLTGALEDAKEASRVSAEADFTLGVSAHDTRVVIWGAPPAVPAGEPFTVTVGIRCSAATLLEGKEFRVVDHEENVVAEGAVGTEPWPGTEALAYSEVELTAPEVEGSFLWQAITPASDRVAPHAQGSAAIRLKITPQPDVRMRVEAFDKDKGTPVEGLHVLMHPFRAATDDEGIAVLDVPKGSYTLHISGRRYFPFHETVEVEGDVTIRAELEFEVIAERVK